MSIRSSSKILFRKITNNTNQINKQINNYDLLTTSLSMNSRYWKFSHLNQMLFDLKSLPSPNKVIILNKNHPELNKWKNKFFPLINDYFYTQNNTLIIDELEPEYIIKSQDYLDFMKILKNDEITPHFLESFSLTKTFLLKYNPIMYYIMDAILMNLTFFFILIMNFLNYLFYIFLNTNRLINK
jgi:hypothetical protein